MTRREERPFLPAPDPSTAPFPASGTSPDAGGGPHPRVVIISTMVRSFTRRSGQAATEQLHGQPFDDEAVRTGGPR